MNLGHKYFGAAYMVLYLLQIYLNCIFVSKSSKFLKNKFKHEWNMNFGAKGSWALIPTVSFIS